MLYLIFIRGNFVAIQKSFFRNSLKDTNRDFFAGILRNFDQVRQMYPNYIMRLYVDIPEDSPNFDKICQLDEHSSSLFDVCLVQNLPKLGNYFSNGIKQ